MQSALNTSKHFAKRTKRFATLAHAAQAKFQKFIEREKMAFSEYTAGFVAAAAGIYATMTLAVSAKREASASSSVRASGAVWIVPVVLQGV